MIFRRLRERREAMNRFNELQDEFMSCVDQFREAFATGDMHRMAALLVRERQITEEQKDLLDKAGFAA